MLSIRINPILSVRLLIRAKPISIAIKLGEPIATRGRYYMHFLIISNVRLNYY
jgi:hypothetical protein